MGTLLSVNQSMGSSFGMGFLLSRTAINNQSFLVQLPYVFLCLGFLGLGAWFFEMSNQETNSFLMLLRQVFWYLGVNLSHT